MGEVPGWYVDIRIAKYLGVDLERLPHIPRIWKQRALVAMSAEAEGAKQRKNIPTPEGQ